jgi:hypothetical protein
MRRLILFAVLFVTAVDLQGQPKGATIVLKTAWAKQFRNQLSIDAKVTVLALNKGKEDDGDSHGGSRQNAAGLPMVAEILNGTETSQQPGRTALDPGASPEKDVYGAWRLWFEHPPPGGGTQCQTFSGTAPAVCEHQAESGADSNPSHSFEIHPVFAVNGVSIARSSIVLTADNHSVKDTDKAFADYTGKNKILAVVRSNTALTLTSITLQDNYVRMRVRLTRARTATTRQKDGKPDGGFVRGDVMSSTDQEQALKRDVRMFYFRDSIPGDALETAKPGDDFVVIGMPRINLDTVLTATEHTASVSIPVPFEFVIVAIVKPE